MNWCHKTILGTVALEKGNNGHDVPLVKDVYASERRRAKVLNFSIAYGKTAHGLAKDWKVDIKEAERTLERYGPRCRSILLS